MKDWIGAATAASMLFIMFGPLLFARQFTIKKHREQFKATGASYFDLPSARDFERDDPEPVARPEPLMETRILDTSTGEIVRVGPDGLPLSEADLSARTPSTTYTVDTERLRQVLQMEKTGEYQLNPATWAEIGAAEAFMADPLGSAVLPPLPLIEQAGNPTLAVTFYAILAEGGLRHDWDPADSDFHFWALEPAA